MSTKLENAHQLHRELTKLIEECELDQEWAENDQWDNPIVTCKITRYNNDALRDSILDKVIEFVNENYTLYP